MVSLVCTTLADEKGRCPSVVLYALAPTAALEDVRLNAILSLTFTGLEN